MNIVIDNLKSNNTNIIKYPNTNYQKIELNEIDFYSQESLQIEEYDAIDLVTFLIEKYNFKPEDVGFESLVQENIQLKSEIKTLEERSKT